MTTHFRFQESDLDDVIVNDDVTPSEPVQDQHPIHTSGLPVITKQPQIEARGGHRHRRRRGRSYQSSNCNSPDEDSFCEAAARSRTDNRQASIPTSKTFPDLQQSHGAAAGLEKQLRDKRDEVECLRSIVHKLSSELSKYQVRQILLR